MSITNNPLEVAREHGRKIAGEIGAETFAELELSYATVLMPKFSNNPLIRKIQHILLYRDAGFLKSTSIEEFARTIPESQSVVNVTSSSVEILFGSITADGKHIVSPLFMGVDIARVDELLSFLGSGNTFRDKVNTMNTVLEGGLVTRNLIKLGVADFPKAKIDELEERGIHFDPGKAQLSFRPYTCLWAASRFIDNRNYAYLRSSGHLFRFHVLQNQISDEEAKNLFTTDIQPDLQLREQLKNLNLKLSRTLVKDIQTPEKSTMDRIFSGLQDLIRDEFTVEKRRLAEVIDIRTKGDIIREMAAHAFIRSAVESDFGSVDKVEYSVEDEEYIMRRLAHFVEPKINPIFVEDFSAPKKKGKRPSEIVKELVLDFLKEGVKQRKEIDEHVNCNAAVSPATISNSLSSMLRDGLICQPKHGSYKLKACHKCESKCGESSWELPS